MILYDESQQIQSFLEFDAERHLSLKKIDKDIKIISEFKSLIMKVDDIQIEKMLNRQLLVQNKMLKGICLDARGLPLDELRRAWTIIRSVMSVNDIKLINSKLLEDYSLFQNGLYQAFSIILIVGLTKKNYSLVNNIFLIYSIYVYSRMFYKYFHSCNNDTFNLAIETAHPSSLFANSFKHGSHLKFIEYIGISQINKLIDLINLNTVTNVDYSRTFSYVKTRINQSLKNFAISYYAVMNSDVKRNTLAESTINNIVGNILRIQSINTTIDDNIIKSATYKLKMFEQISKVLYKVHEDLQSDKAFYRNFYSELLRTLPFKSEQEVQNKLYTTMITALNDKRFHAQYKHLVESIDQFLHYKINAIFPGQTFNKTKHEFRIAILRFLYITYIKEAI